MIEDKAMKYWFKAAELRAVAGDDEFSETREGVIRIAEMYEEMARSMERVVTKAKN